MRKGKPYLPWPGGDDRTVVEEMLRDSTSGQWYECREFIKKRVQLQARNIPQDLWEDLVQDTMIRVGKSLPTFRYQCALRTWLFDIIHSCIIDAYRKLTHAGSLIAPLGDLYDDVEHEMDVLGVNIFRTAEDECITRDEVQRALVALQEHVSTHAHSKRNGKILNMVIFEDRSLEEAAKAVGCSAPVAGYVVRTAQRYARGKVRPPDPP